MTKACTTPNSNGPTRLNLDKRGIDLDSVLCPICNDNSESEDHIFVECCIAKSTWFEGQRARKLKQMNQFTLWTQWKGYTAYLLPNIPGFVRGVREAEDFRSRHKNQSSWVTKKLTDSIAPPPPPPPSSPSFNCPICFEPLFDSFPYFVFLSDAKLN
ncbi:RNA-directed DNA polymerase, eukaryota, reverse transcriptase zinc-binding domain protein [Tanacetum coccineum]